MKIMCLNMSKDGFVPKLVVDLVGKEDPSVLLVIGADLNPNINFNKVHVKGYDLYRYETKVFMRK